jgi:hypothetical protein
VFSQVNISNFLQKMILFVIENLKKKRVRVWEFSRGNMSHFKLKNMLFVNENSKKIPSGELRPPAPPAKTRGGLAPLRPPASPHRRKG